MQALIHAIPEAAKSNRALVAYLVAALVVVIVSLRVTRYELLLKNIKNVPANARAVLLTQALGQVPLKKALIRTVLR